MKKLLLPVLNTTGLAGVLVVNYLAVALPINGKTPGEISDLYPTLFTPAGFTFSIWSVIYLLLILMVILHWKSGLRAAKDALEPFDRIGPWFFINCLLNGSWLFAWHFLKIDWALLIMLGILSTLILVYVRLQHLQTRPWLVMLPFSVYLGWITVATIANTSVWLTDLGWNRFGASEAFWATAMIATGSILGWIMLYKRRDVPYVLVLVWAFLGIYAKRVNTDPQEGMVISAALAAMIALSLSAAYVGYRNVTKARRTLS